MACRYQDKPYDFSSLTGPSRERDPSVVGERRQPCARVNRPVLGRGSSALLQRAPLPVHLAVIDVQIDANISAADLVFINIVILLYRFDLT